MHSVTLPTTQPFQPIHSASIPFVFFPSFQRSPPAPPQTAPKTEPSNVVGVFGLSIRTEEKDLEFEFGRIAPVEKVVIVYDARVSRVS